MRALAYTVGKSSLPRRLSFVPRAAFFAVQHPAAVGCFLRFAAAPCRQRASSTQRVPVPGDYKLWSHGPRGSAMERAGSVMFILQPSVFVIRIACAGRYRAAGFALRKGPEWGSCGGGWREAVGAGRVERGVDYRFAFRQFAAMRDGEGVDAGRRCGPCRFCNGEGPRKGSLEHPVYC